MLKGWREMDRMKEGCWDGQSERQRGWTSAAAGIWLFIVQMSSLL